MKKVVKLLLAICLIAPALISPLSAVNALESATTVPESVDEIIERIQEFETEDDLTSELSDRLDELLASIPLLEVEVEDGLASGFSEELDELKESRLALFLNLGSDEGRTASWSAAERTEFWRLVGLNNQAVWEVFDSGIELAYLFVHYYWQSVETGEDLLLSELGISIDDINVDDIIAFEDLISTFIQLDEDFRGIYANAANDRISFDEASALLMENTEGFLVLAAQVRQALNRVLSPVEGQIYRLAIGGFQGEINQDTTTITFRLPWYLMNDGRFSGVITNFVADAEELIFYVEGSELFLRQGEVVSFSTGDLVYIAGEGDVVYTLIINEIGPGYSTWSEEEQEAFWDLRFEVSDAIIAVHTSGVQLADPIIYYYWRSVETGHDWLSHRLGISINDVSWDDIFAFESLFLEFQHLWSDYVLLVGDVFRDLLSFERSSAYIIAIRDAILEIALQFQEGLERIVPSFESRIFRLVIGGIHGRINQDEETITFRVPQHFVNDGYFSGVVNDVFIYDIFAFVESLIFYIGGSELSLKFGEVVSFSTGDLVYVVGEGDVVYTLIIEAIAGISTWSEDEIDAFFEFTDEMFYVLNPFFDDLIFAESIIHYYWQGEDLLLSELGISINDVSWDDIFALENLLFIEYNQIAWHLMQVFDDVFDDLLSFEDTMISLLTIKEKLLALAPQIQEVLNRIVPAVEGQIYRLAIDDIEGDINQRNQTITFTVPKNIIFYHEIFGAQFRGEITEFEAASETLLFYVGGYEWSLMLGDIAGVATGDTVRTDNGPVYTIIIEYPYDIDRLSIAGIEGTIDQEGRTITFTVPEDMMVYHEIFGSQLRGEITELEANSETLIFHVRGYEWPLMLGDVAGVATGDTVRVGEGLVYTIIIEHPSLTCPVIAEGQFADEVDGDGLEGAPWRLCEDGTLEVDEGFINWTETISPWHAQRFQIRRIEFTGPIIAGTSLTRLFNALNNLTTIEGLTYFDTSRVMSMSHMFNSTRSLIDFDVSAWDVSNVTAMNSMFSATSSLINLDVSNWDVSSVTDMSQMFQSSNLTGLDASDWDTGNVTNMSQMFERARDLISLDVSNWDTSNVTNMSRMFELAGGLISLGASGWDTSSVTSMNAMFSGSSSLTNLDVSNWDTSNVRSMEIMFGGSSSLTNLDVSGWDTSNVVHMTAMFRDTALTNLDVSNWDVSSVRNMSQMFQSSSLTSLDVSGWDTSNVTNMGSMFNDASNLTSLDVSNWDMSNVTSVGNMFSGASSLANLDVSNWDTSNVTSMSSVFRRTTLTSLDVSNWDVSNVTNMTEMFWNASSLTSLDVSNWDTSNLTFLTGMFNDASSLTSLDVSNWDVSNVRSMWSMFNGASSLTNLDVSNWNTSNVTNMANMFNDASSLTSLDMSNWNTSNVTNMSNMFTGAISLKELTLGAYFGFVEPQFWLDTNAGLPLITTTAEFTGYWQNVGNGTVSNPRGSFVFTSDELMAQFDGSEMADTFVWQPVRDGLCLAVVEGQFANQVGVDGLVGSEWRICDGTLEIDEGFISWNLYQGPWAAYVDEITAVVITGPVTAGTSLRSLFRDFQVTEIEGLTYFDTSRTRNMENMFRNATELARLDLSSFDTASVTNMQRMFTSMRALRALTLGEEFIFVGNAGLPVLAHGDGYTGMWQNGEFVFTGAQLMNHFDGTTMAGTFVWQRWEESMCVVVANGRFAHQSAAQGGVSGSLWRLCEDGTLEIDEGFINWTLYNGPWHNYRNDITDIVITGPITAGPSLRSLFRDLPYVTEIKGLTYFDTSRTTSMENMFRTSVAIVALNLISFDSTNVTNMHRMFTNMNALEMVVINDNFTIAENAGLRPEVDVVWPD